MSDTNKELTKKEAIIKQHAFRIHLASRDTITYEQVKSLIQEYQRVSQRSELLAFKQFINKTPLVELELYSDEEFTDLYIKQIKSKIKIL